MITRMSPEWSKRAMELEDSENCTVEVGMIPHQFEKFFVELKNSSNHHLAPLNFYYFVHFSRRKRGLSVKDLSQQADIDFEELMALERDTQYKLKRESVIKLAKYLGVDENALIKMARLDKPHRDPTWEKPAVQCLDNVASTAELSDLALLVVNVLEGVLAREAERTNLEHAA